MMHKLPELPYAMNALEPHISRETLEFHYGKHHAAYVSNLNKLVRETKFESLSLERIVRTASGALFNNAAQAWNHAFYWNSMSPSGGDAPKDALAAAIDSAYGSFEGFRQAFNQAAMQTFGSGWCWLVRNADGTLAVESTSNAGTPLASGQSPLLACDVWEHAYYIDYRNARARYLDAFWKVVNWRFAEQRYAESAATTSLLPSSRAL